MDTNAMLKDRAMTKCYADAGLSLMGGGKTGVRKNYRALTEDERERFIGAGESRAMEAWSMADGFDELFKTLKVCYKRRLPGQD